MTGLSDEEARLRERCELLARSRRRWIDAATKCLGADWNGTPDDLALDIFKIVLARDEARALLALAMHWGAEEIQRLDREVVRAWGAAYGNADWHDLAVREAHAERDAAIAERDRLLASAPICVRCGARTPVDRWCYVHPVCHACVPPPEPLPIAKVSG